MGILPDLKYSRSEAGRDDSKVTEYVRHSRAGTLGSTGSGAIASSTTKTRLLKRGLTFDVVLPNATPGNS